MSGSAPAGGAGHRRGETPSKCPRSSMGCSTSDTGEHTPESRPRGELLRAVWGPSGEPSAPSRKSKEDVYNDFPEMEPVAERAQREEARAARELVRPRRLEFL
mmetsp:Transcript_103161/g.272616  ORF Transcript_103161/g.272616 Transcript_103161/m.272616 type:complete len:103 (-) Transcript_103161:181-489(-)